MAQIIDSTPETVCRELTRLLPARGRPTPAPAPARSAWLGAATPFVPPMLKQPLNNRDRFNLTLKFERAGHRDRQCPVQTCAAKTVVHTATKP
jgi:hypothetical protein